MPPETAAIVGCGLIGGSLALALKRRRPPWRVVCLDLPDRLDAIRDMQAGDVVAPLAEAAAHLPQCGLVVLACPVEAMIAVLDHVAPHLAPGTIVVDVGSVKTPIVRHAWSVMPPGVWFVGGHPIAGREVSGVANADALLFNQRAFFLCPSPDTPPAALLKLLGVVEDLLAIPVTIEPEEHDRLLAAVSHAPQILAVALMHAAMTADKTHDLLEKAAGRGFLDMTRIAASDVGVWRGILAANRAAIDEALDRFESSLAEVRRGLGADDLERLWTEAAERRRRMTPESAPRPRRGELRKLVDQYDEQLLKTVGARLRAVRQIGREKARRNEPVLDPDRERRLLADRLAWAEACDVPPDLVQELFALLMKHSRQMQAQMKDPKKTT